MQQHTLKVPLNVLQGLKGSLRFYTEAVLRVNMPGCDLARPFPPYDLEMNLDIHRSLVLTVELSVYTITQHGCSLHATVGVVMLLKVELLLSSLCEGSICQGFGRPGAEVVQELL